jgi:tetratricopeptide (TPR) repeat protein
MRPMKLCVLSLFMAVCCSGAAAAQAPDAAARNHAASAAMNQGKFDEAAGIYRELLQSMPNEGGLLMNLGMALAMGGHEADAVAPLERAIELKPGLIPAHLFLGSSYLALGRPADAISPLKRVVAARAADVESRRMLAQAYIETGRPAEAVTVLRAITEIAPRLPAGWYALGHAYNALVQDAMESFSDQPDDSPWRQLLVGDALLADGRLTDAFALNRATLERLPSMVSIHDSIARIYELSGHADWAAVERRKGALAPSECARRKALCEFRAGRYRAALGAALSGKDLESRYWRARAATELALASFKKLDGLPDSRERREVHATLATAQRRYTDAIADLKVALSMAPGDPGLLDDLGTAYYSSREFDKAVETFTPLLTANPQDARLLTLVGDSLLQLQRTDEALPLLQRAVERDKTDPMPRLALGRAYLQKGDFAAAVPLIEGELAGDRDGSLHVQLARAYSGLGNKDKAETLLQESQAIQRASQERSAEVGKRAIEAPK